MKKLISLILLLTLSNPAFADIDNPPNDGSQKTQIVDGSGNVIGATSNALDVNIKSGSSAGTEYTEGDTDASITGTAVLMEGAANALVPIQGTSTDGLLVNLGANNDVTVSGVSTAANQTTIIGHVDGVEGLLTTIDADTSNISTKIDTLAGAVSGTEFQVDVLTMPTVTVTDGAGALNVIVDSSALPSGASTLAEQQTQTTALQLIDNSIYSDGSGTVTAGVAVLGQDGTNPQALKTDATGELQIDVVGALPAGTNNIGDVDVLSLPALAAGTNNIGDVDILSIAAGDNNIGNVDIVTMPTVTVTDGAGALNVIVDSSALPTGASTLAEQQTQTTALQLIDNPVSVLGTATYTETTSSGFLMGAVRRDADTTLVNTTNEVAPLQVDANGRLKVEAFSGEALPITDNSGAISVDWNGTTPVTGSGNATGALRVELANNGTGLLTANPGTAANWGIYAEDVAETAGANLNMMGAVRRDTAATSATSAGDNATVNVDQLGRMWGRFGDPCSDYARITSVAVNTASSGNVELVSLSASNVIYVCGYSLIADAAVDVQFIYGTGTACATGETDITGPMGFAANGGVALTNAGVPQFATASANALCIELSDAVQVSGHVTYVKTSAP